MKSKEPLLKTESAEKLRNKYRLKTQTMQSKRRLISKQVILMTGLIIDHSAFTQALDTTNAEDMALRKAEADNLKQLHHSLKILLEVEKFLLEREHKDPGKVVNIRDKEQVKMFDNVNKKLRLAGLEALDV